MSSWRIVLNSRFEGQALDSLFAAAWPGVEAPSRQSLEQCSLCWAAAYVGEELIGFAKLAWDGGAHAFLLDPVVHPQHRRRGLGLALIQELVRAARRGGVRWMHVDYEPHLEHFYRRAGFRGTSAGLMCVRDSGGEGSGAVAEPSTPKWAIAQPSPAAARSWRIEPYDAQRAAACAELLAGLPEWFGIPDANRDYLEGLAARPSWVALSEAEPPEVLGVLTLTEPMPGAHEVHFLAVARRAHRSGVGTALMGFAEAWARGRGGRYMQVKTLGPSHPDRHYQGTRAFYRRLGYAPLFESDRLWDANNPALVQVKAL